MIYFSFGLSWPRKYQNQTDLICFDESISKNKAFSFQLSKGGGGCFTFFRFELHIELWGTDHAGLFLNLAFMDFWTTINFYDSRHWDDDKWEWEVYE